MPIQTVMTVEQIETMISFTQDKNMMEGATGNVFAVRSFFLRLSKN
jgi:hypothetical protein